MKSHKLQHLFILAVVVYVFICHSLLAAGPAKPNIIFILADDLGLPDVGCYGGIYSTPVIDALAANGTRFDYCCSAPECAPSRSMLMTGRYPFRTGCKDQPTAGLVKPDEDGCVAQLMKQAGYATGLTGKWHQLTDLSTPQEAAKWGFDEFLVWPGNADRYWGAELNRNGVTEFAVGKFGPDVMNDYAIDFIRRHKAEPFFFYYPMVSVHRVLEPTPDHPTGSGKQLYPDNITYMDKLIGKLVAELDAQGIRNNTLIIFAGDNGSAEAGTLGGRMVDGSKHGMTEGGYRVPLVANWPGKTPAGVVRSDLVDFTDFLATFAELGGIPLPAARKFDGHSFAAPLQGVAGTPREHLYVEYEDNYFIREPLWKLYKNGELYDMSDAPFREILVPLASTDTAAIAARTRLQAALDGIRANVDIVSPSIPIGVAGVAVSESAIQLSWNASTDDKGVLGYKVYRNNVLVGFAFGSTYSDTGLNPATSYGYKVAAIDDCGNLSLQSTSVTVKTQGSSDTTPPTVSITSPAGSATVSGSITISANASDAVGVTGVKFKVDGTVVGSEDKTAPYSISWNTTTLPDGVHAITAVASDAAGNKTTSSTVTVTVNNASGGDTTPPTVSVTAPTAGSTVSGTVLFTASASDAGGVAGVKFRVDGVIVGAEDTTAPYSLSYDTTLIANGIHGITAEARDVSGNIAASFSVNITVNNPVGGDSDSDGLPDIWELTYFGSISDPRAGAGLDPDGDGFTNEMEFTADTSPISPASRLNILDQSFPSAASFQLQWQSVPGKIYEIQSSTNLATWSTVATVTALAPSTTWTDGAPGSGKKFYRIRIP